MFDFLFPQKLKRIDVKLSSEAFWVLSRMSAGSRSRVLNIINTSIEVYEAALEARTRRQPLHRKRRSEKEEEVPLDELKSWTVLPQEAREGKEKSFVIHVPHSSYTQLEMAMERARCTNVGIIIENALFLCYEVYQGVLCDDDLYLKDLVTGEKIRHQSGIRK